MSLIRYKVLELLAVHSLPFLPHPPVSPSPASSSWPPSWPVACYDDPPQPPQHDLAYEPHSKYVKKKKRLKGR